MAADGSILLTGYTTGDWYGSNAGLRDFVAVMFDSSGSESSRWQVIRNGADGSSRESLRARFCDSSM